MVVLAIITIITLTALVSQSSFNKTLVLANTAYDVALVLRSAQTYGLGSRAIASTANAGYGLRFQNGATFTLFADSYPGPSAANCHSLPDGGASAPDARPGNCVYDASQNERVKDYTLGNGIVINNLCAYNGSWSCSLSSLDVVFARPNADTFMSTNGLYSAAISKACLTVFSPQGGSRYVSVAASGQIIANASSCP